jgi:HAD superfamily hydrolase (TIGR01549 family)
MTARADIRAVLFDVDGTLYRQWPLRTAMAFELALHQLRISGSGSGLTTLRVLKVYRRTHEDLRGQVGSDTLSALQIGLAAARANVEPEAVRTIVNRWMVERPLKYLRWVRRPGLLQLLEDLAQRGIRVGALSDYACDAKLKALGVARFFSLALCTAEPPINALKPDPRGFLYACERWDLDPGSVLYVGDRADVDAPGAQAAGLRCVIVSDTWRTAPREGVPVIRGIRNVRNHLHTLP